MERKRLDLTGEKYGRLSVVKESEPIGYVRRWLCRCDCGNEKVVRMNALRSGDIKSCGCLKSDYESQDRQLKDITGNKYHNLTVIKKTEKRRHGAVLWECKCTCANIAHFTSYELKIGKVKSCGCKLEESRNKGAKKFLEKDRVDGTRLTMLTAKKYKNNTSGHKGVTWIKDRKRWRSTITLSGKTIHLGYFKEIEDAVKARKEAEEKYYKPILEEKENDNRHKES